ncbi:hypothetical protein F383_33057 [Gossypium arboreum]|uniref:Uncharacterized protein n=1 Tax=Gossypium arboreum TaxID=29729 RepID=A0A0B0N268_GOSAR|nr:hypothetical protein F383_33057 [Gossypium arboreum]
MCGTCIGYEMCQCKTMSVTLHWQGYCKTMFGTWHQLDR